MTPTPRPRTGTQSPRETTGTRRRGRPARLLLVVLGVVLSMVAAATPASAEREWYQVSQLNGGDGPARDSFVINDAAITITAKYLIGGNGSVRGVRCKYTFNSKTRGLYSDTNRANQKVKNTVDGQDPTVSNRVLAMDISDSDRDSGGAAGFTGSLTQDYDGATSTSVCKDPNVLTTSSTPSKLRVASGSIVGAAASVVVYGIIAAITVSAGQGWLLGTAAYEAAMGCIAGVAGRLVYDRIVNGKVSGIGYYIGTCALGATGAAAMTKAAGWLKAKPSFLSDAVLSMGRYALSYLPAIETGKDIEMVVQYLNEV